MFVPDILLVLRHDYKDPAKSCIYTNAKPEAVDEILENYLLDKIGSGRGKEASRDHEVRDLYTIKIGLCLEDDSFGTEADTGNWGLTVGIVMGFLTKPPFPKDRIFDLAEWSRLKGDWKAVPHV